ncbi:hypothetical protein [Caenimonas aquaedulcis]|uniref:Uncharacterized protein n=1 Tax=Caenimonas aquaedulcis TaxID=2793270 RepID=A0A931H1T1_9BURK|nr:hypothetical protein [Caenimonas aquaedulcis]MBG9386976.1 hypothetical protein [Caenimonas aquaedulcis]
MSQFTRAAHPAFSGSRLSVAVMEGGMMAAAAAFTAAIWLGVGAFAVTPAAADTTVAQAPVHVTLPTVVVVGRRDVEATPVATMAENTAAIAVTLRQ